MKIVKVNKDKCLGCGACMSIAKNNFSVDQDGLCEVINEKVTDDTIAACNVCPVFAIEIIDDDESESVEENCCCEHCCCDNDCDCDDDCDCGNNCNCGNE